MTPSAEDRRCVQEFRSHIRRFKNNLLQKMTLETQDTELLNTISHRMVQLQKSLQPVIERGAPFESDSIRRLFQGCIGAEPRSEWLQTQLLQQLKRDLLDYPFTLDEVALDSTEETPSTTEIIPNHEQSDE